MKIYEDNEEIKIKVCLKTFISVEICIQIDLA
jgi:hypothetical protein